MGGDARSDLSRLNNRFNGNGEWRPRFLWQTAWPIPSARIPRRQSESKALMVCFDRSEIHIKPASFGPNCCGSTPRFRWVPLLTLHASPRIARIRLRELPHSSEPWSVQAQPQLYPFQREFPAALRLQIGPYHHGDRGRDALENVASKPVSESE